jgi:hypothetical protein
MPFHPNSSSSSIDTYRRALGHVRPGRGMSGTDDHGAHVRLAGSSRAAGDTQSGEHCEGQRADRIGGEERTRAGLKKLGEERKKSGMKSEMLRCFGPDSCDTGKGSIGYFSSSVGFHPFRSHVYFTARRPLRGQTRRIGCILRRAQDSHYSRIPCGWLLIDQTVDC